MTDESDAAELGGLVRSIQALFEREEPRPAPEALDDDGQDRDVAWVTEAGVRLPGDVHTVDPLIVAVRDYIRSDGAGRDELRPRVREAIEKAQERRAGVSMGDAAEALGHFAAEDPPALELARALVGPGVASLLVHRLQDATDGERRDELVDLLPRLGPEMEVAVLDALREEALDADADRSARRALLNVVSEMARGGSNILEEMVGDANWRVVRNAIQIIGDRGGDDALQHLTVALGNDDGRVRREALNALAKVGGENAAILAVGKLEDPDPSVRAQAARTVGLLHAERGLRGLLALMDSEGDDTVVVEVVRALGLLGDPSAVIPLEKRAVPGIFSREPSEVRVAAYRALAAIGTPHATQVLEDGADDKDPQVRRTVQAILRSREES